MASWGTTLSRLVVCGPGKHWWSALNPDGSHNAILDNAGYGG